MMFVLAVESTRVLTVWEFEEDDPSYVLRSFGRSRAEDEPLYVLALVRRFMSNNGLLRPMFLLCYLKILLTRIVILWLT